MKRLSVSATFPYGRQVVDKVRSSTGLYGKKVSGTSNTNAVRVRRGRRR